MNFLKVKELVDKGVVLDIENADEHELRVNYERGDDNFWIEFTPEKYNSEEELAAVINTGVERKRHSENKTA